MRTFSECNPIPVAVHLLAVAGFSMFFMNPIIVALSLLGAVTFFLIRNGSAHMRSHLALFALFAITALINPIFSHNGITVLFVVNDTPITFEAVLYGVAAAAMIVSTLYWFRSLTQLLTTDKLLYLFGKLSPKLSLILSMALRYVPLFGRQAKKVKQTQTVMGLYKDGNVIDRIRGDIRVFSVMVTWALENGIVTADSMTARGYGTGKRTHFSIFKMRRGDIVLICVILALFALTCVCAALGAHDFTFYPEAKIADITPLSLVGYISYGILVFLPTFTEAEDKLKWKYLKSKI